MPNAPTTRPIRHGGVFHDFYMAEMIDGTRRMIGVPQGTPVRLVAARLEAPE
jgi:hypothetical protein